MLVAPDTVVNFIPQRAPMVMVDGLKELQNETAVSFFEIKPDNLFIDHGYLGLPGMVENIAQSAALRTGYLCNTENRPVPLGFIGAVKNLEVFGYAAIGETLSTEITLLHDVLNASVVEGKVFVGDRLLARGEMKVFIINPQNKE